MGGVLVTRAGHHDHRTSRSCRFKKRENKLRMASGVAKGTPEVSATATLMLS